MEEEEPVEPDVWLELEVVDVVGCWVWVDEGEPAEADGWLELGVVVAVNAVEV